jgi:hypothetical protein
MNGYGTIQISDDAQNWAQWGELVESWVRNPAARPGTVAALKREMQNAGVSGFVNGPDSRPLKFNDQEDSGDLVIQLPTLANL